MRATVKDPRHGLLWSETLEEPKTLTFTAATAGVPANEEDGGDCRTQV